MLTSFLIMLREGFEAALVIAILFVYLRRTARADLLGPMWAGVGAAAVISVAAGVVIHVTVNGLTGTARLLAFAAISLFAVVVLTWMIFWMRSHAWRLSKDLRSDIDHAVTRRDNVRFGVMLAAFFAVLREGLESSLFLVAVATGESGVRVLIGGVLGLAIALVAGWLVVLGGHRMPMRQFFTATGVVLIVFAAGLLARAVMFSQSAGRLLVADGNAYDVTRFEWLTTSTETGKFLGAMTGWDPRPSWFQVVVWVAYMVVVTALFLRRPGGATAQPAVATPVPQELVKPGSTPSR